MFPINLSITTKSSPWVKPRFVHCFRAPISRDQYKMEAIPIYETFEGGGDSSGALSLPSAESAFPPSKVLTMYTALPVGRTEFVPDLDLDLSSASSFRESGGRYVEMTFQTSSAEVLHEFELKRERALAMARHGPALEVVEARLEEARGLWNDATSIEFLERKRGRTLRALANPEVPESVIDGKRDELVDIMRKIEEAKVHVMAGVVDALEIARNTILSASNIKALDSAVKDIHRAKSAGNSRSGFRFEGWCTQFVASWLPVYELEHGIQEEGGGQRWIIPSAVMYRGLSPPEKSKLEFDILVVRESASQPPPEEVPQTCAASGAHTHVTVEYIFEVKLSPADLRLDFPGLVRSLQWFTGSIPGVKDQMFSGVPLISLRRPTPFWVDSSSFDKFRAPPSSGSRMEHSVLNLSFDRLFYLTTPLRRASLITPPSFHITLVDRAITHPDFSLTDRAYLDDVYLIFQETFCCDEWGDHGVTTDLIRSFVELGHMLTFDESLLVIADGNVTEEVASSSSTVS